MITGFAIILNEDIIYVSNNKKYNFFEIVLFVQKLITSINPKNTWRLSNIYFEGDSGRERMIIHHEVFPEGNHLFFCITGDFLSDSEEANKMLVEYVEKVKANYASGNLIEKVAKKSEFKSVIKLITGYLWDKYRDPIEDEGITYKCNNFENKIIYCGISSQGLPIISQLYDKSLLKNLSREINNENVELFSSNLSAKLATIAMNTQIRAKTNIKEIHFNDLDDNGCKKLILYGHINGYSLDFFAAGDFNKIQEIFAELEQKISQDQILHNEFSGDLKPFRSLKTYLDEIIHQFDQ
ncbi:MAG: hypothetical protein EU552_00190 [Promethearchaeota archaeon]|nr:MAG: hypothetical protein EU552_00190 [Candidatus Lokiarchaeota archaeon]